MGYKPMSRLFDNCISWIYLKAEQNIIYGQATKGTGWMPWCQEAMKDVASCDKPRGAAKRA